MRRSNKELREFFSLREWVIHLTRLSLTTIMAESQIRLIAQLCRGQWPRKKRKQVPGMLNQNMTGSSQKIRDLLSNERISLFRKIEEIQIFIY